MSERQDRFAEMLVRQVCAIDRKQPPGEIAEEEVAACPLCHYQLKRADAERRLSAGAEEALPEVLERIPPRTHWILLATLAHIEKCPLWRGHEELN